MQIKYISTVKKTKQKKLLFLVPGLQISLWQNGRHELMVDSDPPLPPLPSAPLPLRYICCSQDPARDL